jgi:hypothetical protein
MSGPAGGLDEQRHARSFDVYAVESIGAVIFLAIFARCDRGLLGCVSSPPALINAVDEQVPLPAVAPFRDPAPRKIGPDVAGGSGTNRSAHLMELWVCWHRPESHGSRAVAASHRSRGFPDIERRQLHRADHQRW